MISCLMPIPPRTGYGDPIHARTVLARYLPRAHRIDRSTGLAVVILTGLDTPDGMSSHHPAHLCLGKLFPFPYTSEGVTWHFSPLPPLGTSEIERRARYRHMLAELSIKAGDLQEHWPVSLWRALNWEDDVYTALDSARMAKIWHQVAPLMLNSDEHRGNAGEHWRWHGPLHQGTPAVHFGISKHVPVARLLWTTLRSETPLITRDGTLRRPRRDRRRCIERDCVNPHHFELVPLTRFGRDPTAVPNGNYARTGMLPPRNHHWNVVTSKWVPDPTGVFDQLVLCTRGHPLGNTTQIRYNAARNGHGPTSGTGHCHPCYEYRKEWGDNVPRRPYGRGTFTAQEQREAFSWVEGGEPMDTPRLPQPEPKPDMFADLEPYEPEPEREAARQAEAQVDENWFGTDDIPDRPA